MTIFSAVTWSILFYCPMATLKKVEIEQNFVTIIYCCENVYIVFGNHAIVTEVC